MSVVEDFGLYTIQSRVEPKGYVHVPNASRHSCLITTWSPRDLAKTRGEFEFRLLPAGTENRFYLANYNSGLCLALVPNSAGDTFEGIQLSQHPFDPVHEVWFRFELRSSAHQEEEVSLIHERSGMVLLVDHASSANGSKVLAYEGETQPLERGHHLFGFAPSSVRPQESLEEPKLVLASEPPNSVLPDPPPRPTSTDPITLTPPPKRLVESGILPFTLVNDQGLDRHRQVRVSPFYVLEHYVDWQQVGDIRHDGIPREETVEYTVLMQEETTRTFRDTVTTTKSREYSFDYKPDWKIGYKGFALSGKGIGLGLKISNTMQHIVERSEAYRTSISKQMLKREEVTMPAGAHRLVCWAPVDHFELWRMGLRESPIATWRSVREPGVGTFRYIYPPVEEPQDTTD